MKPSNALIHVFNVHGATVRHNADATCATAAVTEGDQTRSAKFYWDGRHIEGENFTATVQAMAWARKRAEAREATERAAQRAARNAKLATRKAQILKQRGS